MAGVDLYVVKELLGHSSIQMGEGCKPLAPAGLRRALGREWPQWGLALWGEESMATGLKSDFTI